MPYDKQPVMTSWYGVLMTEDSSYYSSVLLAKLFNVSVMMSNRVKANGVW